MALAGSAPAWTQDVHRCQTAAGERVYSDQPCSKFDAEPITAPAQPALPPTNTLQRAGDTAAGLAITTPAELERPAAANGCFGPDADSLRRNVLDAALRADLNGLAGSWHWPGTRAANSVLRGLQELIDAMPRQARLEADPAADDWLWAGAPPPTEPLPPRLVFYADSAGFNEVARFRLVHQAGCLWLTWN